MRRWSAASVFALVAASLVGPFSGAAAAGTARVPSDPVVALQNALIEGHGVRYSAVSTHVITSGYQKGHKTAERARGRAEFDQGRVLAIDVTTRIDDKTAVSPVQRWIEVEGRGYWRDEARKSKGKWELVEDESYRPQVRAGRINALAPATLKAVLATTSAKHSTADGGVRYQGMITLGALARLDPLIRIPFGGRPDKSELKIKVSWRLWVGKDRLIRRLWTSRTEPESRGSHTKVRSVSDLRVDSWSETVTVNTPPPGQVTVEE
ncbi:MULTISPECIES: hypothetical protein [unclassified Nonomuraea]|uniref:hypothetical protein n=1 Tax=unclassified Nonomuraea TaxID=2593643 RepID=UPI0033C5CC88